jgi:hypothetical protein
MIRAGLLLPALLATPATTAKPMVTICSRKGALKIVASRADRAPYSHLAAELVMSPSQVHASVRRAEGSQSG